MGPPRIALLAGACALAACKREPPAPVVPLAPGEVPAAGEPLTIDGELHEPSWNAAARVGVFTAEGAEARPYSMIRLLRDDKLLYLGLYAADQDIRSSDAFELAIGGLAFSIDPRGRITPPLPGARAAADIEDTIDDPGDEDEEWVIEAAIPIAALPPGAATIHAARCDTPKDGNRRCGAWDGPLTLAARPAR